MLLAVTWMLCFIALLFYKFDWKTKLIRMLTSYDKWDPVKINSSGLKPVNWEFSSKEEGKIKEYVNAR